jgi:hypothetical protein
MLVSMASTAETSPEVVPVPTNKRIGVVLVDLIVAWVPDDELDEAPEKPGVPQPVETSARHVSTAMRL